MQPDLICFLPCFVTFHYIYLYLIIFTDSFILFIIDLIAIPDFAAGAMENWGLITYRMTSLLYDEKESSNANKQWVAIVIAHEIAHQVKFYWLLIVY